MSESPTEPGPAIREAYRSGVDALLEGRLDDAVRDLSTAAAAGMPEASLALAKVALERGEGPEARRLLGAPLDVPPSDAGQQAYLLLLDACAAALEGQPDEARRRIDESVHLDSRLEPSARLLRRRIEKGRPPVLRF